MHKRANDLIDGFFSSSSRAARAAERENAPGVPATRIRELAPELEEAPLEVGYHLVVGRVVQLMDLAARGHVPGHDPREPGVAVPAEAPVVLHDL